MSLRKGVLEADSRMRKDHLRENEESGLRRPCPSIALTCIPPHTYHLIVKQKSCYSIVPNLEVAGGPNELATCVAEPHKHLDGELDTEVDSRSH
jgi:hypothetical protein